MDDANKDFCSRARESWEIENRIKLFREAINEATRFLSREKWDKEAIKNAEKRLHNLIKSMQEFEKVKWVIVEAKSS